MPELNTNKTVQQTVTSLRLLFERYEIEDWEPIPGDRGDYSVRYLKNQQWFTISSWSQPTKAQNARQCLQTIQYLFLWAERGVSGITQGVTFIHGGLVATKSTSDDSLAEAYATVGVEASASWEEIQSVYRAKVKHQHPDGVADLQEKRTREERIKRLNAAFDLIEKAIKKAPEVTQREG